MDIAKEYLIVLKDDLLGFIKAGSVLNPTVLIILTVILLIWLMCACFTSSIAEKKGYCPRTNFFLGLALPMAYPIIMVLKAPKHHRVVDTEIAEPTTTQQATIIEEEIQDQEQFQEEEATTQELLSGESIEESYNKAYFDRLLYNTKGELSLHMIIGGNAVNVQKVIDCLDNVLVAEVVDENRNEKKLRIPYAKINLCEQL